MRTSRTHVWLIRFFLSCTFIFSLSFLQRVRYRISKFPLSRENRTVENALWPHVDNPCIGRPTPVPIPPDRKTPGLFFLHIPKAAGSLMFNLVTQYAEKTHGLPCQFLFDGNRKGAGHYDTSTVKLPQFLKKSIEWQAHDAFRAKDITRKEQLYQRGACRSVRGHVTYRLRDVLQVPYISVTIVRDPLQRFLSMYDFVHFLVRTQPRITGWDRWVTGKSLQEDLANSSSILNRAFYKDGRWSETDNAGFSFHFYGVLHQLSGIDPLFVGDGNPRQFAIANAQHMADVAKDNLCSSHIVGSQRYMKRTLNTFFQTMSPYAQWNDEEQKYFKNHIFNLTPNKTSRNIDDHVPPHVRAELECRFHQEIQVVQFAEQVMAYRESISQV